MGIVGAVIKALVNKHITVYNGSRLESLLRTTGPYAIKFVDSRWAKDYERPEKLFISDSPSQTWGTATYVTPISFPLSSALYGRIGLVTEFDPSGWRIYDATTRRGKSAYIRWAKTQPIYQELLLSVHSIYANQILKNKFREQFNIDCVLFHPDQMADTHTDPVRDIWMAVTDWTSPGVINTEFSNRLSRARFTVLIDEEFKRTESGLPAHVAPRQIEEVTLRYQAANSNTPTNITHARTDPLLPTSIVDIYNGGGYLHIFIEP